MSKMIIRTITTTTALATIISENGEYSQEVVSYIGKASVKEVLKHAKAGKVLGKNDQILISELKEETNKYGMNIDEFMRHASFMPDFGEIDNLESEKE